MGKITVRKANGEVVKIDERDAKSELRKIRNSEKSRRSNSSARPPKRKPSRRSDISDSRDSRIPRSEDRLSHKRTLNQDYSDIDTRKRPARGKKRPKGRNIKGKMRFATKVKLFITGLVALAAGLTFFAYSQVNEVFGKMNTVDFVTSDSDLGISSVGAALDKNVINIALFGVDSRGEETGRSDTIMICSINKKTGDINLTSILRDSFIKIAQTDDKDYGFDKINAAFSFGGPQMAVKTINENFDLNIRDYAKVDFTAVADIVDALGGIKVNVKSNEISNLNKFIKENNRLVGGEASSMIKNSGKQTLDGKQALSYCRIRYAGNGDYERTSRQRTVLGIIYKTLKNSDLKTTKKAMEAVLPNITTSLKPSDVYPILFAYLKGDSAPVSKSLTNEKIMKSGTVNGGWCLIFNTLKDNAKYVHKIIYKDEAYTPSDMVEQRNNDYEQKTLYVTKYAIDSTVK